MQRSKLWGNRDEISFALNILKSELENTQAEIRTGECTKSILDLYEDNCILLELAIKKIEELKESQTNETCNA